MFYLDFLSIDWTRFIINQPVVHGSNLQNTSDTNVWKTVFYTARVDKIRTVLDQGQPLPMGMCDIIIVIVKKM